MNAKEFRLQQAVRWEESKQSMRTIWRDLEASLARYHARKPRFDLMADALLAEQPKFTKLWFDLLEWVLIMGALQYLHDKTNSTIVSVVFYVSLVLFALYVPFAIGRFFQFFRFPFIKSAVWTIALHILVSAVAGFGTLYLLKSLVYEIAKHHE
jgi:ABC-type maltose transport system permease subunit